MSLEKRTSEKNLSIFLLISSVNNLFYLPSLVCPDTTLKYKIGLKSFHPKECRREDGCATFEENYSNKPNKFNLNNEDGSFSSRRWPCWRASRGKSLHNEHERKLIEDFFQLKFNSWIDQTSMTVISCTGAPASSYWWSHGRLTRLVSALSQNLLRTLSVHHFLPTNQENSSAHRSQSSSSPCSMKD